MKSLIIELKIIDQQGSRVFETSKVWSTKRFSALGVGRDLQLSSTPQLKAPNTLRSKEIAKQILNPSTAIEQGAVRAQNGLLSMEVLVNENPVRQPKPMGKRTSACKTTNRMRFRLTNHQRDDETSPQLTIRWRQRLHVRAICEWMRLNQATLSY